MTKPTARLAALAALTLVPSTLARDVAGATAEVNKIAVPTVAAEADPRRKTRVTPTSTAVADTLQTIEVEPGINEIIQIAIGHANRIVTPFKAPRVVTTADASVETSANVIYVAPTSSALITMFLTETGDEALSISLTLQPRQIPPRELRLELPPGVLVPKAVKEASRPKTALRAEHGRDYVARAGEVFNLLAQGDVPAD